MPISSDSKAVKVEIPEHDLRHQTRHRYSDKMVYDKSRAHKISLLLRLLIQNLPIDRVQPNRSDGMSSVHEISMLPMR